MSSPDRSTLPADLVRTFEQFDREFESDYGRKPVLPAAETPAELVEVAEKLRRIFELNPDGDGSVYIQTQMGELIDRVLRREVREPVVQPPSTRHLLEFMDAKDHGLEAAVATFTNLVTGTDWSTEAKKRFVRDDHILRKKLMAESAGLSLELTDDEWFAL